MEKIGLRQIVKQMWGTLWEKRSMYYFKHFPIENIFQLRTRGMYYFKHFPIDRLLFNEKPDTDEITIKVLFKYLVSNTVRALLIEMYGTATYLCAIL